MVLEENMGTHTIPDFYIAKYPITNAQFQIFIDGEGGYQNVKWWDFSEFAREWHKENPEPQETTFHGDKLPRTDVTWYESVAFCRWLSTRVGYEVTLPTEQQWQRAAIGDTGWAYPWGNDFDASKCNSWEGGIQQTTAVDRYPLGTSPYGVLDMSGNVWEWTLTEYDTSSSDDISNSNLRVLRGGSWINFEDDLRAASRFGYDPDDNFHYVGLRVACSS